MRQTITYDNLFFIEQDLQKLKLQSPGLSFLLSTPINKFYKAAEMHLKVLNSRMTELKEKFIQQDENGAFLTVGEGNEVDWKYKESFTDIKNAKVLTGDEVEERYQQLSKEFLGTCITIDM